MSESSKLLSQSAFVLLQSLFERQGEGQAEASIFTQSDADSLELSWEELQAASQELVGSGFASISPPDEGQLRLQLTEEGTEAARRHSEVGEAINRLRTKAVSLPPEMRREFETIVADVERKLRQQPENKAALSVLAASLAELFETHVPEITTLLSQIGL